MSNLIKLSLPLNPAYVSTIRLTSSSISERMNFNISEIEDIKTALSETATYIINTCSSSVCKSFDITFKTEPDKLSVEIVLPTTEINFATETEDISLILIKGCMDEFIVTKNDNTNSTYINLIKNKI